MKGFIGKFFGGKSEDIDDESVIDLVGGVLDFIIEKSDLDLSFDIEEHDKDELTVDFYGADDVLMIEKNGQLLEAFQLYLKRVVQHKFSDRRVNLSVDCNEFREKAQQSLVELAKKLKNKVVAQGKPVYVKALPPHDRKVIHQSLAEDDNVKSCSVGNGLYKKIKIYPQNSGNS